MSYEHPHPIPRLAHALWDLVQRTTPGTPDRETAEAMLLDAAAIADYVQAQETNIATMNAERLESEREKTAILAERDALRSAVDLAHATIERLYPTEAAALTSASQRFSDLCTARETLTTAARRAFDISFTPSRNAMGGH